MVIKFF